MLGGNLWGWQASCIASNGSGYFHVGGGGHAGQSSHGGWTIQFIFKSMNIKSKLIKFNEWGLEYVL